MYLPFQLFLSRKRNQLDKIGSSKLQYPQFTMGLTRDITINLIVFLPSFSFPFKLETDFFSPRSNSHSILTVCLLSAIKTITRQSFTRKTTFFPPQQLISICEGELPVAGRIQNNDVCCNKNIQGLSFYWYLICWQTYLA